jgi:hypothetical protein
MYRRLTSVPTVRVTARRLLAVSLLTVFVSTTFPLAIVSATETCHLSCCAGLQPHAAGTCEGGSCHSGLATAPPQTASTEQPEELCGLSNVLNLSAIPTVEVNSTIEIASKDNKQAHASSTALEKPCQQDCGSCAVSATSLKRQRNAAIINHSIHSDLHQFAQLAEVESTLRRSLAALCSRCSPRAPPLGKS